jgi:hypothetical protein
MAEEALGPSGFEGESVSSEHSDSVDGDAASMFLSA